MHQFRTSFGQKHRYSRDLEPLKTPKKSSRSLELDNQSAPNVDFKKINQIETIMKQNVKMIMMHDEHLQPVTKFFSDFSVEQLNQEEQTKSKIPNILKFLEMQLQLKKDPKFDQLIHRVQQLYKQYENSVIHWLSNTQYYDSFFNADELTIKEDKNDFADKIIAILKKNYHLKKQYSRKIAQLLQNELKGETPKKKRMVLKGLKKKNIELRYNRKEKMNEQDMVDIVHRIMSDI